MRECANDCGAARAPNSRLRKNERLSIIIIDGDLGADLELMGVTLDLSYGSWGLIPSYIRPRTNTTAALPCCSLVQPDSASIDNDSFKYPEHLLSNTLILLLVNTESE